MTRVGGLLAAGVAMWLGLAGGVSAQGITGTILGAVTDKTGAVLPGVTVTIRNTGTDLTRSLVTDGRGRYEERQLSIGRYEVKVELQGFRPQAGTLQLSVGAEATLNFTLDVGGVEETLIVRAEAPIVQTTSAEVGALVDQKMIAQLPLNARDIQQLAVLQPGVQSQAAYNGLYGANITVRGSRPEQNQFRLNGVDTSTTFGTSPVSAAGIIMGVEGLQEFKVLSSDYSAAYGNKQGGVVNMVTKSGANEFHGGAYEFHRDSALDAPNYFDVKGKPPFKRDQFGASLGGPIRKGKTFFFANGEHYRHRLGLSNVATVLDERARLGYLPDPRNPGSEIFVPVAPQMQGYLALIPVPNGPNLGGGTAFYYNSAQQVVDESYVTVRIDHQVSDKNMLWAVYTGDWSNSMTPYEIPSFGLNGVRNKQIVSFEDVHTFSSNLVSTIRVGFNRNYYYDEDQALTSIDKSLYLIDNPSFTPSGHGQFPSITITGLSGLASGSNNPVWYTRNALSFDYELNYLRGANSWKFGALYTAPADDGSYVKVQGRGEVTFQTINEFLSGVATRVNINLPGSTPFTNVRSKLASIYAEDSIRLKRLTLMPGLRWEALLQMNEADGKVANLRGGPTDLVPTTGNPILIGQKNNFAPRFGLNWDVFGDGKMSVRGGGGLFYNQITPYSLRELSSNVPIVTRLSINNAPFPNVFSGNIGAVAPDFGAIEYQPKTPLLYSYHAGVQRDIGGRTSVTATYVGSQGRHLPSGNIVNNDFGNRLPAQVLSDGTLFWPANLSRPNPNFGRIGYAQFIYESSYNALQTSIERRVGDGLAFTGNYTYTNCIDDVSGELNVALQNTGAGSVLQYSRDPKSGRGPCSFTTVHSANITTTWDLPGAGLGGAAGVILGGWRWSTITTIQSGYPYNITTGFNRSRQNIGTVSLGDRPNWAASCNADNATIGSVDKWFDPNCFVLNEVGYLGNVPARALRGPGLFTSDWSLTRSFKAGANRVELQAQAFNIFDRANFAVPAASLWASATTRNPTAGRITRTVTPSRQVQLGVKVVF